jgi:ubiquinol-cytochrome c reductase iron-sulfur subunit
LASFVALISEFIDPSLAVPTIGLSISNGHGVRFQGFASNAKLLGEVHLASHADDKSHGQGPHGQGHGAGHGHADGSTRRDFVMVAGSAFAAVGGAMALWPMIDQMNPDASTQALSSVEVDLAPIKEGQAITIMWRGKPVFVRNRTAKEIELARAVKLADLPDTSSRNAANEKLNADDQNRVLKGQDKWLVLVGVCTHLGCIPKGQAVVDTKGDYSGYFCPCHGSHYDTSGRIRKGPAPRNLDVPVYEIAGTKLKIG